MDLLSIAITGLELVAVLAVIISMFIIKKQSDRIRMEEKIRKEEQREREHLTSNTLNGYHDYQTDIHDNGSYLTHRNGVRTDEAIVTENFTKNVNGELEGGFEAMAKQQVEDLLIKRCIIQEPQFISLGDISFNKDNVLDDHRNSQTYKGKFGDAVDVAVKICPYDNDSERKYQENLYKKLEQDEDSKANHVVKYYGIERLADDGKLCLALASELCPWNLAQFLQSDENQKMPFKEACRQMLTGLGYLHQKGISHRDLKPNNVLVAGPEQGYTIKLSDYGNIGRPIASNKINNNFSDNCPDVWIAPEIVEVMSKVEKSVKKFDPSADIFSMGMLCAYVKSHGGLLFENQGQAQKHAMNTDILDGDEPFKHLIQLMTDVDTNKRPNCDECLEHPAFWDSVRVLDFLKTSTGTIQADDKLLDTIEKEASAVVNLNWREQLTKGVEGYIFSPTRRRGSRALYTQDSVRLLLRAIRVLREHFSELPSHVQIELGYYTEDYVKYWTDRFPLLLMHVYNTIQMAN